MSELLEIPHSREAEEAVLGTVLINPEVYEQLSESLCAADFYIQRLGFIWKAFDTLAARRMPIDSMTVCEVLENAGQLQELGGPAFLTALLNAAPTSLHAEAYARLVRETSIRRKMLTAANKIASLAYDESRDLSDVTEQAVKALEEAMLCESGGKLVPLGEVLGKSYAIIDELSRCPELPGTPTGLPDLDRQLGNLQPQDLCVLAARPGQGKTSLLLNIALNAARRGKRVAFFSLEMSSHHLSCRLLTQESGLNGQVLSSGKLGEADWPRLSAARGKLEPLPLYLDDGAVLTPIQIRGRCRRLQLSDGKLDLVIVDYLQLLKPGVRCENRTQEVSHITRALRTLARELDVPILAAAQLGREVEKRPGGLPQLSDLRESGSIENDADVVMFLHKPEAVAAKGQAQPLDILIAKQRRGPVGTVHCLFHKASSRFEPAVARHMDLNA